MKVISSVEYEQKISSRNYFQEACGLLGLTDGEAALAKRLLEGPLPLEDMDGTGQEELPRVFVRTDTELFLLPVFICFARGGLPSGDNGVLPENVTLEFPEQKKIYGAQDLVGEFAEVVQRIPSVIYVILENGQEGAHFLAGQLACGLGMPLLHWDGDPVYMPELYTAAQLYDGLICLDVRGRGTAADSRAAMEELCRNVEKFLVLADDGAVLSAIPPGANALCRQVPELTPEMKEEYERDLEAAGILPGIDGPSRRLLDRIGSMASYMRLLRELSLEAALLPEGSSLPKETVERAVRPYEEDRNTLFGIRPLAADRSLKDLCLPREQYRALERICSMLDKRERVLRDWGFAGKYSYGNGMSILFYGAPGTGKTMAAQAVAGELGLPLYRVDISQLISKYIGETQKNIGRVFEQAGRLKGILFFDEADALFARRNEVGDAQDKYSNAETAYLLQRIEECDGICILATNLLHNFDEAFRRRITFMINFPMPDAALRRKLWESVYPKEAPVLPEVDFGVLAESFELSGAAVRSAALQSACLAPEEGIGMGHILEGISNEYRKMNRSLDPRQRALLERWDVSGDDSGEGGRPEGIGM